MYYTADLHTHSHYAQATSKFLCLETLYQWARVKGINVVGTGDFTHPVWFTELKQKLVTDGNGFYKLKDIPAVPALEGIRVKDIPVRFCLSTEICSIYTYNNKVRKNHNMVYAPNFEIAGRINQKLAKYADLSLDGRPTIPLSSRDLLELVMDISEQAYLVPAHAWTPWFSTLGSKGGYDSVDECFRDMAPYIFALETGLSSDPEMNWQWSKLDHLTMLSSSDAHSPQKLGREANRFDTDMIYDAMFESIKTGKGFMGTFEFFPEEGKYSYDGHRTCGICFSPEETAQHKGICPVCKKSLTIGVMNRVAALADRKQAVQPARAPGFEYIIPLPEILSELEGTGVESKKVTNAFINAINICGNEFALLKEMPLEDIHAYQPQLAEAIRRLRAGEVQRIAGYDGVYGAIHVFGNKQKISTQTLQASLF
ncbi:MAG: endonuclease Q family protein [Ferruginibacter sp.]